MDLDERIDRAYDALEAGDMSAAHDRLRSLLHDAPSDPYVAMLQAEVALAEDDLDAAELALQRAITSAPTLAEAHHRLARLYEERGDESNRRRHDLLVHGLDAAEDRRLGPLSAKHIRQAAERAFEGVPERFRERLRNVPVVLEPRPSRADVRAGLDPRALGLFDGTPFGTAGAVGEPVTAPTRIVLFTANLLALSDDENVLVEEVETTLLHEIAHFFGLDEDEVAELGLE